MSQLVSERSNAPMSESWEPLSELEQIDRRMQQILQQTFGDLRAPSPPGRGAGWAPFVDIEEEDTAYVVEAELPGVKKADVKVEHVGNEVIISGELKERERKGVLRRRTRRTGRFECRITLRAGRERKDRGQTRRRCADCPNPEDTTLTTQGDRSHGRLIDQIRPGSAAHACSRV